MGGMGVCVGGGGMKECALVACLRQSEQGRPRGVAGRVPSRGAVREYHQQQWDPLSQPVVGWCAMFACMPMSQAERQADTLTAPQADMLTAPPSAQLNRHNLWHCVFGSWVLVEGVQPAQSRWFPPIIIIISHHQSSSSPVIIIASHHHHQSSSSPVIIIASHHHQSSSSPVIIIASHDSSWSRGSTAGQP